MPDSPEYFEPKRHKLHAGRPPVLFQSEVAECGLACLAIVAASYGRNISVRELRILHPVAMSGMTLTQLRDVAQRMALLSRPIRLELDELGQLRTPAILHWDLDHFVVLVKSTSRQLTIIDPALGKRNLPITEASQHFTGVALEIWPAEKFTPTNKLHRPRMSMLWTSLVGLRPALLKVLGLSLLLQIAGLVMPLQIQLLIDQAIGRNDSNFSFMVISGFTALYLFSAVGSFLRNYLSLKLTQSLAMGMRSNVINHLARLPLEYFHRRQIGDILNRIESLTPIQRLLQASTVGLIVDGAMTLASLALLFAYGLPLALLVIGSIVLANVADFTLVPYRKSLSHESLLASGRQNTLLIEMIRGMQPLKLFDRASDQFTVWQTAYSNYLNCESKSSIANHAAGLVQSIVEASFNAVIVYVVVQEVNAEHFTIGAMISFLAYRSYFTGAANGLIDFVVSYRLLEIPFQRLADITQEEVEGDEGRRLNRISGRIEFRDVWFRYHANLPWVLEGANFTVEPGEHVAIGGPSGCGKSTVFKLLLRVLQPERGEIRIDGYPLRTLAVSDYRRNIGTVMQNDELFSGSIAENVCMFVQAPNFEQIKQTCQLACLAADIDAMPMGYSTLIGDMGSTLSGGQKQRLLLARAFYAKPSLLLVDEATSHLDAENEKAVNRNLNTLSITRLTIAHRQETLATADRILILSHGKLVEKRRKKSTK